MCVDPISMGALALSAIGSTGAAAGAATGIAGASTLGAASLGAITGISTASAPVAAGLFGTGITASQALIGGSALVGALGAYNQAEGQAAVDEQNARNARATGYANEMQSRDESRRAMASQLAALSARGLNLSSGTPLALMAESARDAELNALTVRANAGNTAAGYRFQARATRAQEPLTIAGQLLGGASKLAALGQI
jgi:hypothetical protein